MTQMQKRIATALAALALGAASAASQAHQGHMEMKKDSAACASAKLSAYFERQRMLTEGVSDPMVDLPTPDVCLATAASSDEPQAGRVAQAQKNADDKR